MTAEPKTGTAGCKSQYPSHQLKRHGLMSNKVMWSDTVNRAAVSLCRITFMAGRLQEPLLETPLDVGMRLRELHGMPLRSSANRHVWIALLLRQYGQLKLIKHFKTLSCINTTMCGLICAQTGVRLAFTLNGQPGWYEKHCTFHNLRSSILDLLVRSLDLFSLAILLQPLCDGRIVVK